MPQPSAPTPADRLIDAAAGKLDPAALEAERRRAARQPYDAFIALILLDAHGRRSPPVVLKACDISIGGMAVRCRQPLASGARGVAQLVRSDGRAALVGVEVRHCRYLGEMQHAVGLRFCPLPDGLEPDAFLDDDGRLRLLDPLLRENSPRWTP